MERLGLLLSGVSANPGRDPPGIRLHFTSALAEVKFLCCRHRAGGKQQSTGLLYFDFRIPAGSKKANTHMGVGFFGDPPGIRTPDPLLKRQLLCQLS